MNFEGHFWQQYREEFKSLLTIAWPITLTQIFMFSVNLLSVVVCGQLSVQYLDAVSLAVTMVNCLGTEALIGMASAFDTLLTQAYGSPYKTQVGLILQRGTLILVLASLPCCGVLVNSRHLLLLLRQDPVVSRMAQEYINYICIGLPALAVAISMTKFLQAQNKPLACLGIWAACGVVNGIAQYVAVGVLHTGLRGAGLVAMGTYWLLAVCHVVYIRVSRCYVETWGGFQFAAVLRGWNGIARLVVSGMLMTCLETWCVEAQIFVVGSLGLVQLGVQTILINLQNIVYMTSLGVGAAASVRIGNSLGDAQPRRAAVAFVVAITAIWMLVIPSTVCSLLLRRYILRLFAQNAKVLSLAVNVFPIHTLSTITDSTQTVLSGVLRGLGQQCFGTVVVLLIYYGVDLPLAYCLVQLTSLQVAGAWWALLVSTGLQTVAYLVRIFFVDWTKETELALARVKGDDIVDDDGADSISSEETFLALQQGPGSTRYDSTDAILPPGDHGSLLRSESLEDCSRDRVTGRLLASRVATAVLAVLCLLAGILVDNLLSRKLNDFPGNGNITSTGWISNVTST